MTFFLSFKDIVEQERDHRYVYTQIDIDEADHLLEPRIFLPEPEKVFTQPQKEDLQNQGESNENANDQYFPHIYHPQSVWIHYHMLRPAKVSIEGKIKNILYTRTTSNIPRK